MTYAKLSSHDFNYFANPIEMIGGKIKPPVLKESNQKIVYRHIFSVVLSYFFRQQENVIFFNSSDGKNTIGAFLDNSKDIIITPFRITVSSVQTQVHYPLYHKTKIASMYNCIQCCDTMLNYSKPLMLKQRI